MSVDVGALGDFTENAVRVVSAGGQEIGIVRWRDAVFAISTVCTHQSGPVCQGILSPRLVGGGPGAIELEDTPVLACPWHGWEYDVRSGRALLDHRYRLRTWPARVVNGRVVVELNGSGA